MKGPDLNSLQYNRVTFNELSPPKHGLLRLRLFGGSITRAPPQATCILHEDRVPKKHFIGLLSRKRQSLKLVLHFDALSNS